MSKFGFLTHIFVVKSALTQLVFEKPLISGNILCDLYSIETYSSFRVHIGKQTPKIWFLNSVKQANGGSNRKSTL